MTVRFAAVLAVVLCTFGVGMIYGATLLFRVLAPVGSVAYLLYLSLTIVGGFFPIILGLLAFYTTYLTNQSDVRKERAERERKERQA